MEDLKNLFDSYSRQARLFPALLTIFAPLVTALAWFPELLTSHIGSTLLTIATSCGLLYWVSSIARSRGKRVELRLLQEWGGWPTTYLLRHASRLDPHTRDRYHRYLRHHAPNLVLPSPAAERSNPDAADAAYASAIKWLKEHVRGKASLVDKENAQYGFRRNMRGMKAFGLLGAVIALLASLTSIGLEIESWPHTLGDVRPFVTKLREAANPAIWGSIIFDLLACLAWACAVTDAWVKAGAEQYAEVLLATMDRS
ncbi:hypothetical protein [Bradyrhizobium sp. NC92]|uniref:hypothetical protein n=1 Tax=Bradyrhizobium sp. (strain NC92) TaxID=55395 RepID=UPI0021AAD243|nr:hypothetical protein [Bradyrhizobium sp. NC92]UWU70589.1 hypothetical protein N2602_08695 [Bradyrhizobium sp. NC92]